MTEENIDEVKESRHALIQKKAILPALIKRGMRNSFFKDPR